jgi:hypothetical protein
MNRICDLLVEAWLVHQRDRRRFFVAVWNEGVELLLLLMYMNGIQIEGKLEYVDLNLSR